MNYVNTEANSFAEPRPEMEDVRTKPIGRRDTCLRASERQLPYEEPYAVLKTYGKYYGVTVYSTTKSIRYALIFYQIRILQFHCTQIQKL